jgi:arylsulfatase A-like enzyme
MNTRKRFWNTLNLAIIWGIWGGFAAWFSVLNEILPNDLIGLGYWNSIRSFTYWRVFVGMSVGIGALLCLLILAIRAKVKGSQYGYIERGLSEFGSLRFALLSGLFCIALWIALGHGARVGALLFLWFVASIILGRLGAARTQHFRIGGLALLASTAVSFIYLYLIDNNLSIDTFSSGYNVLLVRGVAALGLFSFFLVYSFIGAVVEGRLSPSSWILAMVALIVIGAPLIHISRQPSALKFPASQGKNVILIGIDTLRADRTSIGQPFDGQRDTTPNLRKLAERGIMFSQGISQSSWTMPSFASVMTGLYPQEHGAQAFEGRLSDRNLTLAEVLREAGYQTHGIVSNSFVDAYRGFAQGFDSYDEENVRGVGAITSKDIVDSAFDFLRKDREDPFFLWIHLFDPHYTYVDHSEFEYSDAYAGWLKRDPTQMAYQVLNHKRQLLTDDDIVYLMDLYDEELAYTDNQLGRLFRYLDATALSDDTAVIVVGDHGEAFMEHGRVGHGLSLYQEQIHVPFISVLPGIDVEHSKITDAVETRKIFPLVLNYLDIETSSKLENNFLAEVKDWPNGAPGGAIGGPAYSTVWRPDSDGPKNRLMITSLLDGNYKLIVNHTTGTVNLFDTISDPGELVDISHDFPELTQAYIAQLEEWIEDSSGTESVTPEVVHLDEDLRDSLEALGYL